MGEGTGKKSSSLRVSALRSSRMSSACPPEPIFYLTTKDVMAQTKLSRATIDRFAASGALPSYRPGKTGPRRFMQTDIDRFMQRSEESKENDDEDDDTGIRSLTG